MLRQLLVCWLLTIPEFAVTAASPDRIEDRLPPAFTWAPIPDGPMCGVYAVSRALTLLEVPIAPEEFWHAQFVGSPQGSTPQELVAALARHGVTATIRTRLTYRELCALNEPVIANIRRVPEEERFNHWVCLRASDEGLMIYDGPAPGKLVTPAEFLAVSSGNAIVVSGRAGDFRILLMRVFLIVNVIGVTLAILCWKGSPARTRPGVRHALSRIGIAVLASFLLASQFNVTGTGHQQGVVIAAAPYRANPVKTGSLEEVLAALDHPGTLVVDARQETDFRAGTIGRAVNIPVHADYTEIREYLKRVPRTTPVVVFCQSQTCGYDEAIAGKLAQIGFQDLTVSRLGYAEYQQRHRAEVSSITGS